jgi:GR25 family glycosyltransferase involved in LPS biosynthesis
MNQNSTNSGLTDIHHYLVKTVIVTCSEDDFSTTKEVKNKLTSECINFVEKKCVPIDVFGLDDLQSLIKEGTLSPVADITIPDLAWFMTHFSSWKQFLESDDNADLLLMIDDTVKIKPKFKENLSSVLQTINDINKPWNILHLYHSHYVDYIAKHVSEVSKNVDLYSIKGFSYPSMSAYVITRNFAGYLLKTVIPICENLDMFIGQNQQFNLNIAYTITMKHGEEYMKKLKKTKSRKRNTFNSHESELISMPKGPSRKRYPITPTIATISRAHVSSRV